MRKHAVLLTLTLLQLVALVLLAFFWLVIRPDLAATYGFGMDVDARSAALPAATRLALSGWFVPVVGAGGAALFAFAWPLSRGANLRNRLLGAALVWTVLGLAWAMWASYAPAFERLATRMSPPHDTSATDCRLKVEVEHGGQRRGIPLQPAAKRCPLPAINAEVVVAMLQEHRQPHVEQALLGWMRHLHRGWSSNQPPLAGKS